MHQKAHCKAALAFAYTAFGSHAVKDVAVLAFAATPVAKTLVNNVGDFKCPVVDDME
jgi:hypothetical protein